MKHLLKCGSGDQVDRAAFHGGIRAGRAADNPHVLRDAVNFAIVEECAFATPNVGRVYLCASCHFATQLDLAETSSTSHYSPSFAASVFSVLPRFDFFFGSSLYLKATSCSVNVTSMFF